jgi:hypothetical protein
LPARPASIEIVPLPTFRRLVRFSGTLAETENALAAFNCGVYPLPVFAEVQLSPDAKTSTLDINEHFRTLTDKHHGERMQILRVVQARALDSSSAFHDSVDAGLEEFSRTEVFAEKLKKSGWEGEEADELLSTFTELLTLLDEGAFAA